MAHNETHFNPDLVDEFVNKSHKLLDKYLSNKAVDEPAYSTLIGMYSVLILLGALGNLLVIISVVRKPSMRTPRNMFIVNLAVSDLILCAVTMPLTLMQILTKYYPLGENVFVCRIIGMLQATSTFVSTISITAIALDRYQVIVYPTNASLQIFGAVSALFLIWMSAILLATPLFVYTQLDHYNITIDDLDGISFCIENWPVKHGRAYYSIFVIIVQYTLPIIIVSVAYARISYKLRYRFAAGFVSSDEPNNRRQLRGRRLHRTNLLLGSIAIIFCISWLPLNLFNLLADLSIATFSNDNMKISYAICHMIGMSSACSNPVLYGCLNENFWKEFKDILCTTGGNIGDNPANENQKNSLRKQIQKNFGRNKPDVVNATNDYKPCTTVSSDMTVLTRC